MKKKNRSKNINHDSSVDLKDPEKILDQNNEQNSNIEMMVNKHRLSIINQDLPIELDDLETDSVEHRLDTESEKNTLIDNAKPKRKKTKTFAVHEKDIHTLSALKNKLLEAGLSPNDSELIRMAIIELSKKGLEDLKGMYSSLDKRKPGRKYQTFDVSS